MRKRGQSIGVIAASVVILIIAFVMTIGVDREVSPQSLYQELRCIDCSGLSIADSEDPLSAAMRAEVDRQLADGLGRREILDFFENRYSSSVLMSRDRVDWWVWVLPLAFGVCVFIGLTWGRDSVTGKAD